jgi:hypothetical protein
MPNPYLSLVESWKDLPAGIAWSSPDTVDGEMSILAPLTIGGVTVGAFALRATCNVARPDCDVMFQLETGIPGQRTRLPLARIDWRPLSGGHKQPKRPGSRKRDFIVGSHFHALQDNWVEADQRMKEINLPWGQPLDPEPATYMELLDLVRNLFRFNDISGIGIPEWAAKL